MAKLGSVTIRRKPDCVTEIYVPGRGVTDRLEGVFIGVGELIWRVTTNMKSEGGPFVFDFDQIRDARKCFAERIQFQTLMSVGISTFPND